MILGEGSCYNQISYFYTLSQLRVLKSYRTIPAIHMSHELYPEMKIVLNLPGFS